MGCGASHSALETVDDSVHVMLKHDKNVAKKKGIPESKGYVPRAEHPLMKAKNDVKDDGGGGTGDTGRIEATEE